MIHWLMQKIFSFLIKILLRLKPAVLFHKINQLHWYQNTLHKWIKSHDFNNEIKILEIGCATGLLSAYLSERGYITTAVDISEVMITTAKSNNANVDHLVANVKKMPFLDGEFDVVIAASLINIIPDKLTALEEMKRVCKQGGFISILVPMQGFKDQELQYLCETLRITGFSEAALRAWHKYAPKMEISSLKQLFQKAGLTVVANTSYLQGMVMSITAIKD